MRGQGETNDERKILFSRVYLLLEDSFWGVFPKIQGVVSARFILFPRQESLSLFSLSTQVRLLRKCVNG